MLLHALVEFATFVECTTATHDNFLCTIETENIIYSVFAIVNHLLSQLLDFVHTIEIAKFCLHYYD